MPVEHKVTYGIAANKQKSRFITKTLDNKSDIYIFIYTYV